MLSIRTYILPGLLALLLLTGCRKSQEAETTGSGDTVEMTFSLQVAGADAVEARAIVAPEDHNVRTLDVLVFEVSGAGEIYSYTAHATDIDNAAQTKSFKVVLRKSTTPQRLVFIANAQAEIGNATFIAGTTTKEDALKALSFAHTAPWATSGSQKRLLPMWGEASSTSAVAADTQPSAFGTIQLLRSVVRIDVGIDLSDENTANGLGTLFTYDRVRVYNPHTNGAIAPDPASLTTSSGYQKVTLPTIYNTTQHTNPAYLSYTHSRTDFGGFGEVYTPEFSNAGKTESQRCFLLIGGYYTASGDDPAQAPLTWYRVDFRSEDGATQYDLLRNHRYLVNITAVSGPGYADPDEAAASPSRLSAHIIPWDRVEGNIFVDYPYRFDVDKSLFRFNVDGRTEVYHEFDFYSDNNIVIPTGFYNDHLLTIDTDHPRGWSVHRVTDENGNTLTGDACWVTIEKGFTVAHDENGNMTYDPDQAYLRVKANTTDSERAAIVYLRAGSREHAVNVIQDYIVCGRNNVPMIVNLWGNDYKTHLYADPFTQVVRCWMGEEHLRDTDPVYNDDPDYVFKRHHEASYDGERGYYFVHTQIYNGFDPCPPGWRMPHVYEMCALMRSVLNLKEIKMGYDVDVNDWIPNSYFDNLGPEYTYIKWWNERQIFSGSWSWEMFSMAAQPTEIGVRGQRGIPLWSNHEYGTERAHYLIYSPLEVGLGGFSVRCVRELDNKD